MEALEHNTRLNYSWQSVCDVLGLGSRAGLECWGVNPPQHCGVVTLCYLAQGDVWDLMRLLVLLKLKRRRKIPYRYKKYKRAGYKTSIYLRL
jgi:hypothetical protein